MFRLPLRFFAAALALVTGLVAEARRPPPARPMRVRVFDLFADAQRYQPRA